MYVETTGSEPANVVEFGDYHGNRISREQYNSIYIRRSGS